MSSRCFMKKKLKILYLPPDSIQQPISRSYFIKDRLRRDHEVYLLQWNDFKNFYWENQPLTFFHKLTLIWKNFFRRTTVRVSVSYNLHIVHTSLFFDAFINRVLGRQWAKKIMYHYARYQLKRLLKIIQPDVVFHADGFYYSSVLSDKTFNVVDFQDDFSRPLSEVQRQHLRENLSRADMVTVLSQSHAYSLQQKVGAERLPDVIELPNGVDDEAFCHPSTEEASRKIREAYGQEARIVSFIGSEVWLDVPLASKVLKGITELPWNVFVVFVGNITPFFTHPRVVFVGGVSPLEANAYYKASDVGLLLKEAGTDFLYNSIPLKILQYGICGKPVIIPPIAWFEDKSCPNIFMLKPFVAEKIIETCRQLLQVPFEKEVETMAFWNRYSWTVVVEKVTEEIEKRVVSENRNRGND